MQKGKGTPKMKKENPKIKVAKDLILKLSNSEREFRLSIGKNIKEEKLAFQLIENDKNNQIYYYQDNRLEDLHKLCKLFRLYSNIDECIEKFSKIISDNPPKLSMVDNQMKLEIKIFLPGEEPLSCSFILPPYQLNEGEYIENLIQQIQRLDNKVSDLELKVNKSEIKPLNLEKTLNENLAYFQKQIDCLKSNQEVKNKQYEEEIKNLKIMLQNFAPIFQMFNVPYPNFCQPQQQNQQNQNSFTAILKDFNELNIIGNRLRQVNSMFKGYNYYLLYRASRDGDSSSVFHQKCDQYRSTLTLIKTTKGIILGGYTYETWMGKNIHKKDDFAFCFSLYSNKIYNIKKGQEAIFCCPDFGPYFGGNYVATLGIYDKAFKNGGLCCRACDSTYENFTTDYEINNNEHDIFISEIEVFRVDFY